MGDFKFEYDNEQNLSRVTYQAAADEPEAELFPRWTPAHENPTNRAALLDLFKNYGMNAARPLLLSFLNKAATKTEIDTKNKMLFEIARLVAEEYGKKSYTIDNIALKKMIEERNYIIRKETGDQLSGLYGTYHDMTIMKYAVDKKYRALISVLIRTGAHLDESLDGEGHNILHVSANEDWPDVLKVCLDRSDLVVNQPDGKNKTALHFAAQKSAISIMTMLIVRGANIHAQDQSGNTPLHSAVLNCNKEAVELLLKRSNIASSLTLENNEGHTPLAAIKLLAYKAQFDNQALLQKYIEIRNMIQARINELKQTPQATGNMMQIDGDGGSSSATAAQLEIDHASTVTKNNTRAALFHH